MVQQSLLSRTTVRCPRSNGPPTSPALSLSPRPSLTRPRGRCHARFDRLDRLHAVWRARSRVQRHRSRAPRPHRGEYDRDPGSLDARAVLQACREASRSVRRRDPARTKKAVEVATTPLGSALRPHTEFRVRSMASYDKRHHAPAGPLDTPRMTTVYGCHTNHDHAVAIGLTAPPDVARPPRSGSSL